MSFIFLRRQFMATQVAFPRSMGHLWLLGCGLLSLVAAGCAQKSAETATHPSLPQDTTQMISTETPVPARKTATFGSGCFWCTEAVFQHLKGVESVTSGYMGGTTENPTYEDVCQGTTGHAEVIQITYDPNVLPFESLLQAFFKTHDPTTLNRQGADFGTQYRSAIFYHDEQQKELAEKAKELLDAEGIFSAPIVTEITPASTFYPAEKYHQNFYRQNPNHGYCAVVIRPKVEKMKALFAEHLKPEQDLNATAQKDQP